MHLAVGDGAFLVALAWEVYALSDAPTALAVVGIAMTVPTILFLLVGGVASDRLDRRSILIAADVGRGVAVGLMAVLAVGGWLELWHLVVLAAVYGTGSAFFAPAFDAFVPDLLRPERLAQANALDQLVRPLALRLLGPALGGVVIGVAGASAVFALDAASFAASCAVLLLIHAPARRSATEAGSVLADLRAGWRACASGRGCGRHSSSAAIAYLLFMGPVEVLLPYVVKHPLHGDATDLGMVFAAGGLGSVICAVMVGRRGLPRRDHDRDVRRLDARDAGRRRVRARVGDLAADAREPGLQRARDGRHDHLGDSQAAPCPGPPAGTCLELGLVDLDRAAAVVVRAHRPSSRRVRRAGDAGGSGDPRRDRHGRRAAGARHASCRGAAGPRT